MNGKRVILSTPEGVADIDAVLAEIGNCTPLREEQLFKIRLALGETVQNAIVHGNKTDPSKRVVIAWQLENQVLEVCVSDEGSGFELEGVEDPTSRENLEKEGGRGVLFLKTFTKGFHYCNKSKSARFVIDLK
jgi:serine/threonine-protein kinase RsbW